MEHYLKILKVVVIGELSGCPFSGVQSSSIIFPSFEIDFWETFSAM